MALSLRGTHGTSVESAAWVKDGSGEPHTGRAGRGVYVWAESHYSFALAVGWYRESRHRGRYGDEAGNGGIVLYLRCDLTAEAQLFDLTDVFFQDSLMNLLLKSGKDPRNDEDVGKAAEVLCRETESRQGEEFLAVQFLSRYPNEKHMAEFLIDSDGRWPSLVYPAATAYSFRKLGRIVVEKEVEIK